MKQENQLASSKFLSATIFLVCFFTAGTIAGQENALVQDPSVRRAVAVGGLLEIPFSVLSLSAASSWGPDANTWVGGFVGFGGLAVTIPGLLLSTQPLDRKLKVGLPIILGCCVLSAVSIYSATELRNQDPQSRTLSTFAMYQGAVGLVSLAGYLND